MSLLYEPSKTTIPLYETSKPTIPLKNALSEILHVSTEHLSKLDQGLLHTCPSLYVIGTDPCFIIVPEDENSVYQELINYSFSFAFVSLLQVARRNGASYLHVSPGNDVISGLHTFCEPL